MKQEVKELVKIGAGNRKIAEKLGTTEWQIRKLRKEIDLEILPLVVDSELKFFKKSDRNFPKTLIFTSWSVQTPPSSSFVDILKQLSTWYNAEVVISPLKVSELEFVPQSLLDFSFITQDVQLNSNLKFKYVQTTPTAVSPTSGWSGAHEESIILPGLVKDLVTEKSHKLCKQIISAGSVGRLVPIENRVNGRAFEIAKQFTVPCALIVDLLDNKTFFTRYVTMEKEGTLYDKNLKFTAGDDGPAISRPSAIVLGDQHAYTADPLSTEASLEMCRELNPKCAVLQDFYDGAACNYHSFDDHAKVCEFPSIEEEAKITRELLEKFCNVNEKVYWKGSNHEDFLLKYLANENNYKFGNNYKTAVWLRYRQLISNRHPVEILLDFDSITNLEFVPQKEPLLISKVTTLHGSEGISGRRLGFRAQQKIYNRFVMGHCLLRDNYKIFVVGKGLVPLEEATVGDTTLGFKNGHVIETKILDKTNFIYSGDFYFIKFDSHFEQKVTDGHHFYTNKDEYIPVEEFVKRDFSDIVFAATPINNNLEYNIGDAQLKLLIATCADGSYDREYIRFKFVKQRKMDRLTALCKQAGFELSWYTFEQKGSVVHRCILPSKLSKPLVNLSKRKTLPKWLLTMSTRQIKLVVDEIKYWDGSVLENNGFQYSSRHKEDCKIVLELLARLGIFGRLLERKPGRTITGLSPSYLIIWNESEDISRLTNGKFKPCVQTLPFRKEYEENEFVDCITTEAQNFLVINKHGKVMLTGNCHEPNAFRNGACCGTNSTLNPDYSIGASAWMGANVIIQPDSSVQILPVIEGLWKLPRKI